MNPRGLVAVARLKNGSLQWGPIRHFLFSAISPRAS